MTQSQRRQRLIELLMQERQGPIQHGCMPQDGASQRLLLRALLNVRPPMAASEELLRLQDSYLQARLGQKQIVDADTLPEIQPGIKLWRGDITNLRCDAIVNAANSALLGCFCPNHGCIDNAIHTYAGVQLRLACAELMARQGHGEMVGQAKLTPGFNLPCRYVLHTVGPYVEGRVTRKHRAMLASCYRSCLDVAEEHGLGSVAFCCISTGEFHFPNDIAAEIALETVTAHPAVRAKRIQVVLNVFKEQDERIYRRLLEKNQGEAKGGQQA